MPWKIKGKSKAGKIITKEDAIFETMNINHISKSDDIKVDEVKPVYSQSFQELKKERKLNLCWRVNFKRLNSAEYSDDRAYGTTLIDAVSGEECILSDY